MPSANERARIVADRVAVRIREVVPEELGRWAPPWDYISSSSDVFMDALKEWENTDSPSTRSHVEVASTDLIGAWAEAARQWEAAGCPRLDGSNTKADEVGVGEFAEHARGARDERP